MAKHRRIDSHDNAGSTGPGTAEKTRGHAQIALWVEADGLDPETDQLEVRVEGSPDDTHYAPLDRGAPAVDDTLFLDESDLVESDEEAGVYVGYIASHQLPVEYVRANIVTHSGGFDVTTHVFIGGWGGRGKSFKEREDFQQNTVM